MHETELFSERFQVRLVNCQVDSEQRPHKVSFYVDKAQADEVIKTLIERFKERQARLLCLYKVEVLL